MQLRNGVPRTTGAASPKTNVADLSPVRGVNAGYNTASSYLPAPAFPKRNWCWPALRKVHHPVARIADFPNATLIPNASLLAISRTFNSLFKVLFIFPSRYLFAIGLSPVFSFRWNIPPTLGCSPKQPDSLKAVHMRRWPDHLRDCHPPWCPVPEDLCPGRRRSHLYKLQFSEEILNLSSSRFIRHY